MRLPEKMRGGVCECPQRASLSEIVWSWVGGFVGIGLLGLLHAGMLDATGQGFLIGSFGATAVLIYGAPRSPFAQPRNVLGGHLLSALIGVATQHLLGGTVWLASAVAVSAAIACMHMTRTLHPPGGASALIAVIGGESVHRLGWSYALVPVGLGAAVLLAVGLVVNNMSGRRRYPDYWF